MKRIPIVGITAGLDEYGKVAVAKEYIQSVAMAGGMPIVLPIVEAQDEVWYQMQAIDALVLSGGGDVSPHFYGREPMRGIGTVDPLRDAWEIALCRLVWQRAKPILGICRGMQVLNIALGGDVYTAVEGREDVLEHYQTSGRGSVWHTVQYTTGSLMERLFGASMQVNSYHHQALRRVGEGLTVTGMATDGIIESIEGADGRAIGVQWHPELIDSMKPLWQTLVRMAGNVAE